MFNVITVATKNYRPYTKRLFASLQNSGNDFHLTIFCDDPEVFGGLARSARCTVRDLPEIRTSGVKRARFAAYYTALQEGSFLYLDSDVIVLKPIAELAQHSRIAGCYDDLSFVSIIPDKRHPWAGDPGLDNRWFINSGVFFAPRGRRGFFTEVLERSRNDELWEKYGVLYDNSFLCAHFNLLDEAVDYVDSSVYNWQGFVVGGRPQVTRRGNSLVNCQTGKVLKIAHFAGVSNPDAAMSRWPVEVTSLLSAFGSMNEISRERAFVDFLGTLNAEFDVLEEDEIRRRLLNALAHETMDLTAVRPVHDRGERETYFSEPEEMASLVHAKPSSGNLWNGLNCGGAYLDGDEYNFVLRAVQQLEIRTAVHFGTRQTATLLANAGVETLCLEIKNQPLRLRAGEQDLGFAQIALDEQTRSLEAESLRQAIKGALLDGVDLLLMDLPEGVASRSVLFQLLEAVNPKYVLVHDARLNSAGIFECQQTFNLRLLAYLPSNRGLAVLGVPSAADGTPGGKLVEPFESGLKITNPRVRVELADTRSTWAGNDLQRLRVTITNLGTEPLSSRYDCPVLLSYHWMTANYLVSVQDGVRSILPFDVLPGCSATFTADIALDAEYSVCCITMVQEHVLWFDQYEWSNRLLVRVEGENLIALPAPGKAAISGL